MSPMGESAPSPTPACVIVSYQLRGLVDAHRTEHLQLRTILWVVRIQFGKRSTAEDANHTSLAPLLAKNPTVERSYSPANTNPGQNLEEAPTKAYRSGEKWGSSSTESEVQDILAQGEYLTGRSR